MSLANAAASIERQLRLPDRTFQRPVLILISGLPGSGKSYFSRILARRVTAAIVATDFVRCTLYQKPRYSPGESYFVYQVSHLLIRRLLDQGYRVIFDATNLLESKREELYRIADDTGAQLVIVRVVAPDEVIRRRLQQRQVKPSPEDLSEATWEVYEHMRQTAQPIRRQHFVVNTAGDIDRAVTRVARAIAHCC